MTNLHIVNTHFATVYTLFTSYDTVHTHFDIVHPHFGAVHTLFTSYDTVHTHFDIRSSPTLWHSTHIVHKL